MTDARQRTLGVDDLAPVDDINEEIWVRSADVQAELQAPRSNWRVGEVGAQQSMCGTRALAWVPDLVGADLNAPGSMLVVGMSYAGFIRRPGSDRGTLTADEYTGCQTAAAFTSRFTRLVVPKYRYYRNLLDALPAEVTARRVGFTDLCRACFIEVGPTGDTSSGVERADKSLFSRYVEHPHQQRWHRQRILRSGARVLIAVGHVAEHGLLRLLRDGLGCTVRSSVASNIQFTRRSNSDSWPIAYAHSDRKIAAWAATGDWWEAASPERRWQVVTVPHTSESPLARVHVERIRRAWEGRGVRMPDTSSGALAASTTGAAK